MGIVKNRGRFYWVKRIPKRYLGVVRSVDGEVVQQARQALHTDSRTEALKKAALVEAEKLAEWEALLAGDEGNARKHYQAARDLAQARGYPYKAMSDLAGGDVAQIIDRVLSLSDGTNLTAPPAATDAVLGAVPVALPGLSEVLIEYYSLTKTRHLSKSENQRRKWRLPRDRAVRNFLSVVAGVTPDGTPRDMPINTITADHALKFRNWWSRRVESGLKIESANKDIGHLSEVFRTWCKLTKNPLSNPFADLRLEGRDERGVPGFSREWVRDHLLAPGALDGLNAEARDVLLIMINTGLRPSEITDAPLEDFEVTANVPFLRVAPHGRELKVAHTRRDIPLLGVSLEAARRIVARGGPTRYHHKAGSWSAAVNKFLRTNGLRESPAHTAYSLRHYVENALLAARVDDRVRADILGHKYNRPSYGDGGALSGRADALALIAL
ncbi:tyrosine-type recombinase/integrase [Roseobacter litoralis]|uniref:tyrosine-type recombinase/integrase n=1 Tax=Roseobacter litoralis TaxID=42443 RepID=UPI002494E32D|nr:tyrosine-type recombinase/integrase [Roseobacter litoralis]